MKVIDFILDTAYSDLKQTALFDVGTGAVTDTDAQKDNIRTLLSFVNQGLVALHSRFPLKVGTVEFDTSERYNSAMEGVIELGTVKLPDEALSLIDIVTDDHEKVPLDDKGIQYLFDQGTYKKLLVRTVAINTYVVSGVNEDGVKTLYFTYRAIPDTVKVTSTLPLPSKFVEALRYYVAFRGYSTIKSTTTTGDVNVMYKKLFDDACNTLEDTTDMLTDDTSFNENKLWKKNFV